MWHPFIRNTIRPVAQDKTDYGLKDGEVVSNLYEKLVFKIPKVIEIPMNVEIRPKNPVATVYGDYQNLSLRDYLQSIRFSFAQ